MAFRRGSPAGWGTCSWFGALNGYVGSRRQPSIRSRDRACAVGADAERVDELRCGSAACCGPSTPGRPGQRLDRRCLEQHRSAGPARTRASGRSSPVPRPWAGERDVPRATARPTACTRVATSASTRSGATLERDLVVTIGAGHHPTSHRSRPHRPAWARSSPRGSVIVDGSGAFCRTKRFRIAYRVSPAHVGRDRARSSKRTDAAAHLGVPREQAGIVLVSVHLRDL
jgi:hypothetical protein